MKTKDELIDDLLNLAFAEDVGVIEIIPRSGYLRICGVESGSF